MTKKILIIGNSPKEYALARKLAKNNEVFVAPGSAMMKEFATLVDIREDSVSELLDFVLENGIDITITVKSTEGAVLATKNMKIANSSVTKLEGYSYEWVLETAVTEDCIIEVVNNSPSNNTGNKDRVAIWNFTVTGVAK